MKKSKRNLIGVIILAFALFFTTACTNVKDEETSKEPVNSEQSDMEQGDVEDIIQSNDDKEADVNNETATDTVIEMEDGYEYGEDYGGEYSDGTEIDGYVEEEE